MKPYLLLGEAPNDATDGRPDLWLLPDDSGIDHAANRLLRYSGLSFDEYDGLFDRDNVLHEVPPRPPNGGRGYTFPIAEARKQAQRIVEAAREHRGLVVLGRRTAATFRWANRELQPIPHQRVPLLEWHMALHPEGEAPTAAVIVPHPSGLNAWWNDEDNQAAARQFFDDLKTWAAS